MTSVSASQSLRCVATMLGRPLMTEAGTLLFHALDTSSACAVPVPQRSEIEVLSWPQAINELRKRGSTTQRDIELPASARVWAALFGHTAAVGTMPWSRKQTSGGKRCPHPMCQYPPRLERVRQGHRFLLLPAQLVEASQSKMK